ncbi:hypothetical protein CATRI_00700 [Corynebacterium atrinae]|uniref:hypothetical protein n=1 Tax=Corynebacterium atrinae TaxID=1336740 RepID=UPI0025B43732|nr:hypothetical protein [Corynebacterium atrinae]WJY62262.1 hypothetical protein CATRI_00700 [Corynebacterium atrinae]
MSSYRLKPAASRHWWFALFGATAVIVVIPLVLNLFVPKVERMEQVQLQMRGMEWTIPLDMECLDETDLINGEHWVCDGGEIYSMIAEGGTDPERTLRRMMRAITMYFPPEDALTWEDGDARLLIDYELGKVGISLEGSGEQEGLTMVAVLPTGPDALPMVNDVWQTLSGSSELPWFIEEEITYLESVTPRDAPAERIAL